MIEIYKPSGKVSPVSVGILLAVSLIVTPLLAVVYVLIQNVMPLIYLNLLLTIGFGFALSYVIGYAVIKTGKVRSPKVAIVFGVVAAAIAGYIQWGIWLNHKLAEDGLSFATAFSLLTQPDLMLNIIREINQIGHFSIGKFGRDGAPISGGMLSAIWIGEAAIITGIAVFRPFIMSKLPYCEDHNKWFKKSALEPLGLIEQPAELLQKIEADDPSAFDAVERANRPDENFHSRWFLHSCDGDVSYLTIVNMLPTYEKNKVRFVEKVIIDNMKISIEMKNALQERIKVVYG